MKGKVRLPKQASYIVRRLTENGYGAYVVGGCVRDSIMGKTPKDWDVATSATPAQVKELFPRTLDTGIQHGTVTVMMGKTGYEVTTYRVDGEYEDGRHPKGVSFTSDIREDLKRRDFTINAMAYNEEVGLVDAFDGMGDMERGVIRCVGDPALRFEEDALRMLRAIRFSAVLGFVIEEGTAAAIRSKSENIRNVSAERIRDELNKTLASERPGRIRMACELGLTSIVLPELDRVMEEEQKNEHHVFTIGEHSIRAVEEMGRLVEDKGGKEYTPLCWTMLLHDAAKPLCRTTDEQGVDHFYGHDLAGAKVAESVLRRLKFDNATIETVSRLIRWHDYRFGNGKREVRRALSKMGADLAPLLFLVQRADAKAQNPKYQAETEERIARAEEWYHEIMEEGEALTIQNLAVNGWDLMEVGVPGGREVGRVLKELLEAVLENPERNTREDLLKLVEAKKED